MQEGFAVISSSITPHMPKQVVREYIDRYISNSWGLAIITLVIAKGMLSDSGVIAKGNVISYLWSGRKCVNVRC